MTKNDENGGCHAAKGMVYQKRCFLFPDLKMKHQKRDKKQEKTGEQNENIMKSRNKQQQLAQNEKLKSKKKKLKNKETKPINAQVDSICAWYIVFFPVLKPLISGRQSRLLGWFYKLPGGQNFIFKLSPLSVGIPQRMPLNLKKTADSKLPRGAICKPRCVQLINNLFCYTSNFYTVKEKQEIVEFFLV